MESRKGGCLLVPRYGPGAGSGVGGQAPPGMSWQMGKIMLKFRPIAPKPAAMAPVPTPAPVAAAGAGKGGKRKAVGGGKRGRKPKKAATVAPVSVAPASVAAVRQTVVEKESDKEKSLSSRSSSSSAMTSVDSSPPSPPPSASQPPATLSLMPVPPIGDEKAAEALPPAPAPSEVPARAQPPPLAPFPTTTAPPSCWITVEDVTSTWRDGEAPSAAAAAAAASSCGAAPAFVSDQWGRVTWSNAAFTRAAASDDGGSSSEGGVSLAGSLPAWGTCAGFTCRVRVRRSVPRRGGGGSVVAPCDVWRLDATGCYLWRLDLQAALTLGGLP